MTPEDEARAALKVGEVIAALGMFPPDAPLKVVYDCRCAEGFVRAVEVEDDSVALILD